MTTPTKPGHYWAKWRIADDGTPEGDEQTPCDTWEVVQVNQNGHEPDEPDYLLVAVPGQVQPQSIENFFWGPGPLTPPGGKP